MKNIVNELKILLDTMKHQGENRISITQDEIQRILNLVSYQEARIKKLEKKNRWLKKKCEKEFERDLSQIATVLREQFLISFVADLEERKFEVDDANENTFYAVDFQEIENLLIERIGD